LGDADDVVKLVYETKQHVIGEMDISMAAADAPYEMVVFGTRGSVTLAKDRKTVTTRHFSPKDLPDKPLHRSLASPGRAYPRDNIEFVEKVERVDGKLEVDVYRDFARAIRTGRPPLVVPEEPLAVMRVMDQCRANAGRIVQTEM
jgi:predicted dehydrogenase